MGENGFFHAVFSFFILVFIAVIMRLTAILCYPALGLLPYFCSILALQAALQPIGRHCAICSFAGRQA